MSYLNQRLQVLRDLLKEHKLDGLLISTSENRRYLSGFADLEGAGYLLVTANEAFLATEFHATEASRATSGFRVVRIQRNLNWVPALISQSGGEPSGHRGGSPNGLFQRPVGAGVEGRSPSERQEG